MASVASFHLTLCGHCVNICNGNTYNNNRFERLFMSSQATNEKNKKKEIKQSVNGFFMLFYTFFVHEPMQHRV